MATSPRQNPNDSAACSTAADPLKAVRAILVAVLAGMISWAGIIWVLASVVSRLRH
jgi:hypothetical protein